MKHFFFLVMVAAMLLCKHSLAKNQASLDSAMHAISLVANDSIRVEHLLSFNRDLWRTSPSQSVKVSAAALQLAEKIHNETLMIRSGHSLSYAYFITGDYPPALANALKALRLCEKQKDYPRLAELYLTLANIHDKNHELSKAKEYIKKALAICEQHQLENKKAKVLNELAIMHHKKGDLKKAISIYDEAIVIARAQKDSYYESFLLGNTGIAYKDLGDHKQAMSYFRQAMHIGDSLKVSYTRAISMLSIGELYYRMNEVDSAAVYVQNAMKIAKETRDVALEADCYDLLSKVYEKGGRYKEALANRMEWSVIRDTMYSREKSMQMADLQTRYDTELKDDKIALQEIQLAKNHQFIIGMSALAILLFFLGLTLYSAYQKTKALNARILQQKTELEALNNTQQVIFSVISHDLRKPINTLHTVVNVLGNDPAYAHRIPEYKRLLHQSLTATEEMVDNLLQWTLTQMKGFQVAKTEAPVHLLFDRTLELYRNEIAGKSLTLTPHFDRDFMVNTDHNILNIVLRNLVHNAIKYTPSGGSIHLHALQQDGKLIVRVQDSGVGIDEQHIARLFDKRVLYTTAGTHKEAGTGLGLSLCYELIRLLDGDISVHSVPGEGSTFTVSVPLV